MKTSSKILALLSCALCCVGSARAKMPPTHDQVVRPDPTAVAAATPFLALIDSGSYTSAWEKLTPRVRRGGTLGQQEMMVYLRSRRAPLGGVRSRTLGRARFSKTITGGPDGAYEFLDYETVFSRKAHAFEVVTLTKESGHWEVSGYHVY